MAKEPLSGKAFSMKKIFFTLTTSQLPYCLVINSHEHTVHAAFLLKGILTREPLSPLLLIITMTCCSALTLTQDPELDKTFIKSWCEQITWPALLPQDINIVTKGHEAPSGHTFNVLLSFIKSPVIIDLAWPQQHIRGEHKDTAAPPIVCVLLLLYAAGLCD